MAATKMKQKILQVLKEYTCHYMRYENERPLYLIDIFTPPKESNFQKGILELILLAEFVFEKFEADEEITFDVKSKLDTN